jgi:hypothetical protein
MNRRQEDAWREAKRRCGLNDEEVRMARELGFQPKSLIKKHSFAIAALESAGERVGAVHL